MISVIKQFFFGEPVCENVKRSEDYQKAYGEFSSIADKFTRSLTEQQYKEYMELEIALFGVAAECEEDYFVAGFKYGMAFALESQRFGG